MARDFNGNIANYLNRTTVPISGYPFSVAGWIFPRDLIGDHNLIGFGNTASDTVDYFSIRAAGGVASDPVRMIVNGSSGSLSGTNTTTAYNANTWNHLAGVVSASSQSVFLNGGGKATSLVSLASFVFNRMSVGVLQRNTINLPTNGLISDAAVWNAALTDAEVASLAAGASPLLISPDNLVFYAPLIGNDSPEPDYVGGLNLTVNGTVGKADGPRLYRPRRKQVFFVPPAPAPTSLVSSIFFSSILTGET